MVFFTEFLYRIPGTGISSHFADEVCDKNF
jgi:hypothetical protein